MAKYNIKAQYEYEGTVEADSPEEAEKVFWSELNDHYAGTYDYECEEIKVCETCGYEGDADEFEGDDCDDCASAYSKPWM